ncbi:hypothetical protein CMUS01_09853 [Colletotrichum musicola]|uniref:Uncharacterized protein n=1 Tax=Colletotrichum musicola TaxID=2175873 RepID=A0A8H6K5V4_9PEZI|nr:hypothetical protein CMUS01_09853 [Colletotrichum musicola]
MRSSTFRVRSAALFTRDAASTRGGVQLGSKLRAELPRACAPRSDHIHQDQDQSLLPPGQPLAQPQTVDRPALIALEGPTNCWADRPTGLATVVLGCFWVLPSTQDCTQSSSPACSAAAANGGHPPRPPLPGLALMATARKKLGPVSAPKIGDPQIPASAQCPRPARLDLRPENCDGIPSPTASSTATR